MCAIEPTTGDPICTTCGNGLCDANETCQSCIDDCFGQPDGCEGEEVCVLNPDTNEGECGVNLCGNGDFDAGEECDDGNLDSGDGCAVECIKEYCGDGIPQPIPVDTEPGEALASANQSLLGRLVNFFENLGGQMRAWLAQLIAIDPLVEQCDDGNDIDDDECSNFCQDNYSGECGDDFCDAATETCASCVEDCVGNICPEGGGVCVVDPETGDPSCQECTGDDCPTCGDGICDTSTDTCAECPEDCVDNICPEGGGVCVVDPETGDPSCQECIGDDCPTCGDGICDTATDTCAECPEDCVDEFCPEGGGVCGINPQTQDPECTAGCVDDGVCQQNETCDCDCIGLRDDCPVCLNDADCSHLNNACVTGICSGGSCQTTDVVGAPANCCISPADCGNLTIGNPTCQEAQCVGNACIVVSKSPVSDQCLPEWCDNNGDCDEFNTPDGCTVGICGGNNRCTAIDNPEPPAHCDGGPECDADNDCQSLDDSCQDGRCQNGSCVAVDTCPEECQNDSDCSDRNDSEQCIIGICSAGQCEQRDDPSTDCQPECDNDETCQAQLNTADGCFIGVCSSSQCIQIENPYPPLDCITDGGCESDGECVIAGSADGCYIGRCDEGSCVTVSNDDPPPGCFPPECESSDECEGLGTADGCYVGICNEGSCIQVEAALPPPECFGPDECQNSSECNALSSDDGCYVGTCVSGQCQQIAAPQAPASCRFRCESSAECTDFTTRNGCYLGLCINGECEQHANPTPPAACLALCQQDTDCADFGSPDGCYVGRCFSGLCEQVVAGSPGAQCDPVECTDDAECIHLSNLCTLGACVQGACAEYFNPSAPLSCGETCEADADCGDLSTNDGCKVGLCIDSECQQHIPAGAAAECGSLCGNKRVEVGEDCDLGSENGLPTSNCTATCQLVGCPPERTGSVRAGDESCPEGMQCLGGHCAECLLNAECQANEECVAGLCVSRCGNGTLESAISEQCDDGNLIDGDGCSADCRREPPLGAICGDGALVRSEQCDDGNADSGDGCDLFCRIESTLVAPGPQCGNGFLNDREECDDGNRRDFDGCGATCYFERGVCGDGVIQQALGEQCEQAVHDESLPYRCGNTCRRILLHCGNGELDQGEQCDEGVGNSNLPNGMCRQDCTRGRCGDAVIDSGEQCDDGNLLPGDGCDRSCAREPFGPNIAGPTGIIPFPGSSGSFLANLLPFNLRPAAPGQLQPETTPGTGPVAITVMAAGAAAGLAWMRRRRQ